MDKYTKIALPDNETFMKGYDKGNTLKIAIENGIPCPETYFNMEELYENQEKLVYPLVVKPRISSEAEDLRYATPLTISSPFTKNFRKNLASC